VVRSIGGEEERDVVCMGIGVGVWEVQMFRASNCDDGIREGGFLNTEEFQLGHRGSIATLGNTKIRF